MLQASFFELTLRQQKSKRRNPLVALNIIDSIYAYKIQ